MKNPLLGRNYLWLFIFLVSFQLSAQVTRQPYLQSVTSTSVVIRWQSGTGDIGKVHFGVSLPSLDGVIAESEYEKIYHQVLVTGLTPNTKYYYTVDGSSKGTAEQYFVTAPKTGSAAPVRVWVISDFGQTNSKQNPRRLETIARWKSFNNDDYHASLVLSLGDQTEDDAIYQLQHNYFNLLEPVLKTSPLFTVIGNHDFHDSACNYTKTFTIPSQAEASGIASGSQLYYSFDYANIHVVVLCTEIEDNVGRAAQINWLKKDLDNNRQEWLIACMHRPLHSGGYHRSDVDLDAQVRRSDWLRILEDHGVDLVLQGHNHVYERSYLLDNLIGKTTTVTDANKISTIPGKEDEGGPYRKKRGLPHKGTMLVTVPGGGVATKNFEHYSIFPVYFPGQEGSLVIDVNGSRMDVKFLSDESNDKGSHVWDHFTIIKND